jgi:type VI secretion system secreted protein VgrG
MSRTFILHTPLEDDLLKFRRMDGNEALSEIGQFDLQISSASADIDPTDLLGASMTIEIATQFDSSRYINGVVVGFAFIGPDGSAARNYLYHARLHSWLFLADKSADCRIYQQKSVPDIIKAALADFGMPFEFKLNASYDPIPYCVQFNETVLNYVKRLAELAGIYWYIRHEMGAHTIVFCDGANPTLADYSTIPFLTPGSRTLAAEEQISEWHVENELKSGRFTTRSYNFKHPKANLQVNEIVHKDHANDALEMFEWSGAYAERDEGAKLVTVRREQQQLHYEKIHAVSNVRGIAPGYTFTLTRHPRDAANGEYLIVSAVYHFQENAESSRSDGEETRWRVDFTVRSTKNRYYPARVTHKPVPGGPHTALVTGPAGEEIWTNEYGQVKVYFYWDRHSAKDETSSCWVRVSSVWAGNQFGGMHVPRIGQEVLVEYVNGNIDMPIVTGRVYNQNNMPPWDLPANATQSGILSRSSKDGEYANANAIRFEDKKGAEQVWIQAERNMDTVVENDETHHVMHDRTKTIDHDETVFVHHDRTETVDNNETITIHNNRSERVDNNETISIGVNRNEDVGANENVMIGANKMQTIAITYTQNVGAVKMTNVGAAYLINVGAAMNRVVGLASAEEVGLSKTTLVGDGHAVTVANDQKITVGGNQAVSVGKTVTITAGDSIELVCGKSTLKMNKDGTISINGHEVDIGTDGNQILKAGGDITLKASNINEN